MHAGHIARTCDLRGRTVNAVVRLNAPTELYIPNLQYPNGYRIEVSEGVYETKRNSQEVLYWHSRESSLHKIKIMS